jgi:magnesium chelatase family protein
MLDRIDIHIEVPRVDFEKLSDSRRGEGSDEIRARVEGARQKQRERFAELKNGVMTNADMRVAEVRQFCELDIEGQALIKTAMTQLQLSARAYHRILKLARTIADLAGEESIQSTHLAEALQYRPKGMMV